MCLWVIEMARFEDISFETNINNDDNDTGCVVIVR